MSEKRKYVFDWNNCIGNMEIARPSLGPNTRVEAYRLLQFSLRDVCERFYGTDQCDVIFREAGVLAGTQFYQRYCQNVTSIDTLTKRVQEEFKRLGIGILRLEKVDLANLNFTLTVSEDLDCSGLPDVSEVICVYDEGMIQGILQAYTGKKFVMREIDCWCTGKRTCRFAAKLEE